MKGTGFSITAFTIFTPWDLWLLFEDAIIWRFKEIGNRWQEEYIAKPNIVGEEKWSMTYLDHHENAKLLDKPLKFLGNVCCLWERLLDCLIALTVIHTSCPVIRI